MTRGRAIVLLLALGGLLTLTACLGGGSTSIRDLEACYSRIQASHVHGVGSSISFTVTTVHGETEFTVPKTAFGGAPEALKNGDAVTFCAELVDQGGYSTTTITQFSDLGQPAATATPMR